MTYEQDRETQRTTRKTHCMRFQWRTSKGPTRRGRKTHRRKEWNLVANEQDTARDVAVARTRDAVGMRGGDTGSGSRNTGMAGCESRTAPA